MLGTAARLRNAAYVNSEEEREGDQRGAPAHPRRDPAHRRLQGSPLAVGTDAGDADANPPAVADRRPNARRIAAGAFSGLAA
jgi:hypothetical protein